MTELDAKIPTLEHQLWQAEESIRKAVAAGASDVSVLALQQMVDRRFAALQAARATPRDEDTQVAAAMFAPFSEDQATSDYDQARLAAMLQTAPAARVIDTHSVILREGHPTHQQLFRKDAGAITPRLFAKLYAAMDTTPPQPSQGRDVGEACWYEYWGSISGSVLRAACLAGIHVSTKRDVTDTSITAPGKCRDRLWYESNVVVLCGEDKQAAGQEAKAEADLQNKHRGASKALYGHLKYILGYSTGGTRITFHALPVDHPKRSARIAGPFNAATPDGMVSTVVAFINIVRWIKTIKERHWLPDISPPSRLFEEFARPAGPMYRQVLMSISYHHVNKSFSMQAQRLCELLPLYLLLSSGDVPHAVRPRCIMVNGDQVTRDREQVALGSLRQHHPTAFLGVDLELEPVGCVRRQYSSRMVYQMVHALLSVLKALHQHGWCHRDIRLPNVLDLGDGQFALADWELAAPAGAPVSWMNECIPVALNDPYYPHHDLWQVGQLVRGLTSDDHAVARNFAGRLQGAGMLGHDAAATALQELEDMRDQWEQSPQLPGQCMAATSVVPVHTGSHAEAHRAAPLRTASIREVC